MRPSIEEVIDSIEWSLDHYVANQLEDEFSLSVLKTVRNLLRHVQIRVNLEGGVLYEDIADLKQVLLGAAGGSEAGYLPNSLAAKVIAICESPFPISPYPSVTELADRQTALLAALDELLVALSHVSSSRAEEPAYCALRNNLRAYLARHLDRNARFITPAFQDGRR